MIDDAPAPGSGRALAALIAGNVCLAFGPWLVRLADVGPVASGFWRVALAAPLLLLLTRATGARLPRLSGAVGLTLLAGGVLFAADLATWHMGILRTRLANATLFGNSTAFFFAAYGFLVARAWPGRAQAAALLLALLGVGLLMGRSYELSPKHLAGDLLCLTAGLCYTAYLIAVDRARGLGSWPILAVASLAAAPPLLVAALVTGEPLWPGDWTPLVLLALGSQVVGQGLMVFAIGRLPALVVGLGLLTQPIVAAVIGWLVYHEQLGVGDLIGAAMIAAALVLVRIRR